MPFCTFYYFCFTGQFQRADWAGLKPEQRLNVAAKLMLDETRFFYIAHEKVYAGHRMAKTSASLSGKVWPVDNQGS
ncbi:hypothetical protein SAMN05444162_0606 [Paenibacillaceae bacterium GAS479]|nr:hypothetical protein SAMN05444162_0606 [Paenibacillaceae bacterium GAS479]